MTPTNPQQEAQTSEARPSIAKVKGRAICPKGHRKPRVQYLADDDVFCCTTCATMWKASFEVTIPAGMSCEDWVRMGSAAPDLLASTKELAEALAASMRVIARHNLAEEFISESRAAGVKDGVWNPRAKAAIVKAEKQP